MKQITIVTENRPGVLAELTEALAAANINIEDMDAESHENFGIIILNVDRYDEALQVINQQLQLKAVTEDVILVRIEDQPGALAKLARKFKDADINIRSIRIVQRDQENNLVAICTERSDEAMKLVEDILVS